MPDPTPTQPGFLRVSFDSPSCYGKLRVTYSPVSGFPLRASISSSHIYLRSRVGLPSSCMHLFIHATAWELRRSFTSSPITDDLVLPSACVTTLGNRNKLISERYQHFREHGLPYGLHDSLCTLRVGRSTMCLSFPITQHSIRVGG